MIDNLSGRQLYESHKLNYYTLSVTLLRIKDSNIMIQSPAFLFTEKPAVRQLTDRMTREGLHDELQSAYKARHSVETTPSILKTDI